MSAFSRVVLLLSLLLASGCARPSLLEGEAKGFGYQLLTFEPAKADQRFPLLLVLHGTGETSRHYFELWEKEAKRRKVIVVAPAIQELNLDNFYLLVEEIARKYPVDRERILLAGVSSGALVARWLLNKRPSFWRGVILVASPTGEHWAEAADVAGFPPLLFVHGGRDPQFKLEEIAQQAEVLKERGVKTTLFSYPDAGHEQRPEWSRRIFDWMEARLYPSEEGSIPQSDSSSGGWSSPVSLLPPSGREDQSNR